MEMRVVHETIADHINELHAGIEGKLKTCVKDAIQIGRLLVEQKAKLDHGEFLPWIMANCDFSDRTARNYMRVHQHRDKTESVSDLQEAYRKVEQIEAAEKQREKAKQTERIETFKDTGQKPETWTRSDDYEVKKRQDREERAKRINETFEAKEQKPNVSADDLRNAAAETRELKMRLGEHAHLSLDSFADDLSQAGMFLAIEKYVNGFADVSGQLEAVHNLIKKLKTIASDLQRRSVEVST